MNDGGVFQDVNGLLAIPLSLGPLGGRCDDDRDTVTQKVNQAKPIPYWLPYQKVLFGSPWINKQATQALFQVYHLFVYLSFYNLTLTRFGSVSQLTYTTKRHRQREKGVGIILQIRRLLKLAQQNVTSRIFRSLNQKGLWGDYDQHRDYGLFQAFFIDNQLRLDGGWIEVCLSEFFVCEKEQEEASVP